VSDKEIYKEARKKIYDLVKDVPALTNKQLDDQYNSLMGKEISDADVDRDWKIQAIVRLLQHKYYKDNSITIPPVIQKNFESFFEKSAPKVKKRRTPKKKTDIDRKVLNEERVRLLHTVTNACAEIIHNGNVTFHPNNKYGTVKSGKSVVMFIERKLRKIIAFMGGERDRKNHPKLEISIGIDDDKIKPALVKFIGKNLEDFSNIRDKRWEKCELILEEVIKAFKKNLKDFNDFHSHPTGRYTTFKRGRLVLVFITQDRAKGEIAFHPGGERENDPDVTTTIKVSQIKKPSEVEGIVKEFIDTHYTSYMEAKNENNSIYKKEMKHILDICKKAVSYDKVLHHPKDFFGLVKNKERPIVMVKRSKKDGHYDVVAWVKKQKDNPSVTVKIDDSEDVIIKSITDLVKKHLEV